MTTHAFFAWACIAIRFFSFAQQQQPDTILVYDIATQTTGTILPISFNPNIISDGTSSSFGSMGTSAPVSLIPPFSNLFSGSNFSRLARAATFFNVTDYPVRTAVSLRTYKDTLKNEPGCTGMIIAPCMVLTSGNCVYGFGQKDFIQFDSLLVLPAYDNGQAQPSLPRSQVAKVYLFKTFYTGRNWDDVALLELKQPIGLQTGWTGIGFDSSSNYSDNKVFHKFSYPATYQPGDSSKYYNGDTLYYNYGYINDLSPAWYGVQSPEATGIPGQGGSTFMYTANDTDYFSVGLSSFSYNYMHYKISNAAFYQLQNVMTMLACNANVVGIKENAANAMGLKLYPNPFSNETMLEFNYDPSKKYTLTVTNSLGQQLRTQTVSSGRTAIPRENLSAGIYFLQLNSGSGSYSCKLVVE